MTLIKRKPVKQMRHWTRERMLSALRNFHAEFGFCATNTAQYDEKTRMCGRHPLTGEYSRTSFHRKYPSFASILRIWPTFRDAFREAGFEVDSGDMPWSKLEDWWIVEASGLYPRTEIADEIGRTEAAVKRRLYDIGGIKAKERFGFSANFISSLMEFPAEYVRNCINAGIVPSFKGNKYIYINPADMFNIPGIDWSKVALDERTEIRIRAALVQRVCKILKYGKDFRNHEIYKFPVNPKPLKPTDLNFPPKPIDIKKGCFVQIISDKPKKAVGRVGIVRQLFYSKTIGPRTDGTKRKCWLAEIDFTTHFARKGQKRLHLRVPLDQLKQVEKPYVEPKPLSMTKVAIESRAKNKPKHHLAECFEKIRSELT